MHTGLHTSRRGVLEGEQECNKIDNYPSDHEIL